MDRAQPKTLEDYMALPYTDWVRIDEDEGGFYAGVVELPGCLADGETRAEALEELQDAKRSWLGSALHHGDPIPLPLNIDDYSGRILVRAPRSLHRDLAERATLEGVSLNQLCVSFLSRALGLTGRDRQSQNEDVQLGTTPPSQTPVDSAPPTARMFASLSNAASGWAKYAKSDLDLTLLATISSMLSDPESQASYRQLTERVRGLLDAASSEDAVNTGANR